jgi:hypothetical protein
VVVPLAVVLLLLFCSGNSAQPEMTGTPPAARSPFLAALTGRVCRQQDGVPHP